MEPLNSISLLALYSWNNFMPLNNKDNTIFGFLEQEYL